MKLLYKSVGLVCHYCIFGGIFQFKVLFIPKVQNIVNRGPWVKVADFYLQLSGTPLSPSFCTAPTSLSAVVLDALVTVRIIFLSVQLFFL
jgi:hypothetical protein